ncbi:hypothetical protein [Phenylobacterium sp. SCN 70-31]|uniref:DUF6925 family protein n=1 Tax=Phenylobacterium sp. SCN 70-31 TaxID=1660129 RepID=UPI00086CDC4D|nr:hypothetical protein [Phenylobacterium sp. SCN 70-31]ODT87452.1 MAG: hypothetical protein ABS78_11270 [Phenylobacterium sp. SCN 70-31]
MTPRDDIRVVAYDTLSSDGETWGQSVAFCLPAPPLMDQGAVRALGTDEDAIRPEDRAGALFDLGVGRGHVRFCARTRDAALIAALTDLEGQSLFSAAGAAAMTTVLAAQPHRVVISPLARVEVYAPIPQPGGKSPDGPHTHLLPKLIASGRTHAANAPIPPGLQPALMLHPRSPWRDAMGLRTSFDPGLDRIFQAILDDHALDEDRRIRRAVEAAVSDGQAPETFAWPDTRRGRIQARITLRRLAQQGRQGVSAWRRLYDREPAEGEPDEETALHA